MAEIESWLTYTWQLYLDLPVRYIIFTFLLILPFNKPPLKDYRAFQLNGFAQGTTYHITYYARDSIMSSFQADSILDRIDSSLSVYKPYSLITRFNQSPEMIRMDQHFARVVRRSLEVYADSKGIFDITVYPLVQAWGFGPVKTDSLPDSSRIEAIKQCVGSEFLQVNNDYLYKTKPCVKLDMNGIAQGYSVDVLADFLEQKGTRNYLVELGGEIRVKGKRLPGNIPISIGIEAPPDNEFSVEQVKKVVTADSGAFTTSGSYRKFRESNGQKISHIIDPRTGYPSINELISVTVYAKDAITADGYDNTLMVMGLENALHFVEARKDIAAYFIYRKKDGSLADTASRQFYMFIQP